MRILAVDGDNLLIRALKATESTVMTSELGEPTAALVIFINMLFKYVRYIDPTHMIVCWDDGHEFRTKIDPNYKAQREEKSIQARKSLNQAQSFLTLCNIQCLKVPGMEADDLLANIYWSNDKYDSMYIVSGDKDILQLIDERTFVVRPSSGFDVWDERAVREAYGCSPHELPYVFALVGDKVDNVSGFTGIGIKTAVKLLEKFDWQVGDLFSSDERLILANKSDFERFHRNYELVDLIDGFDALDPAPEVQTFDPRASLAILGFCQAMGLTRIEEQIQDGTLWKGQSRVKKKLAK